MIIIFILMHESLMLYLLGRERYRELIEAADTITEMKNSSENVS